MSRRLPIEGNCAVFLPPSVALSPMTDPDWTADEAYRILRTSIERFLASESNAAGLHLWLTDTLSIGIDGISATALATATDVSTTGVKSVSLASASSCWRDTTTTIHEIYAYYAKGGSEPTTGKANVVLLLLPIRKNP